MYQILESEFLMIWPQIATNRHECDRIDCKTFAEHSDRTMQLQIFNSWNLEPNFSTVKKFGPDFLRNPEL